MFDRFKLDGEIPQLMCQIKNIFPFIQQALEGRQQLASAGGQPIHGIRGRPASKVNVAEDEVEKALITFSMLRSCEEPD